MEFRSRGADALRPSTLEDYERVLNNRILKVDGEAKFLRDVRLSAVSKKHVSDWWDIISRDFDTPTRNYNAYKRLRTSMEGALDRQLILVNPCTVRRAAVRPVPKRKELPETQVLHDIIEELDHSKPRVDGRNKLAAILMLFHGLRINEVLGGNVRHLVKVGDNWEYWVRKNAYRNKNGGMLITDTPKSSAGWREVPIFPIFNDDVEWHLEHFGGDPDALLFPSPTGKVIVETSFRSILDRAKTRAGYKDIVLTPHYGRVWMITTLAEAGMQIPEIGAILGQVDLRTITEVYMRASKDHRRKILGNVNNMLESKKPPQK